ncbi:MAG: tetratricopeptide repeat protein [Pseudomonadota bacterium]
MLETIWAFLSDPTNREVLAWIGGGLATVFSALWMAISKLKKRDAEPAASKSDEKAAASAASPGAGISTSSQLSTSSQGGIATGGDATISGPVNITNNTGIPAWVIALALIGLVALGYAAFFAGGQGGTQVDCRVDGDGSQGCGDVIIGITLEQYEGGLRRRAEEVRAEEAEKRGKLERLVAELGEASAADRQERQAEIDTLYAQQRTLAAESAAILERQANLQVSYDALLVELSAANSRLERFGPLIDEDIYTAAQEALVAGDILGAEERLIEIADAVGAIKDEAAETEAEAVHQAGELAEQRIDWRTAYDRYQRAAQAQPDNWRFALDAGRLAGLLAAYPKAIEFGEAAVRILTAERGPNDVETAKALDALAQTYASVGWHREAQSLYAQAIDVLEAELGENHPTTASSYSNLGLLFRSLGEYANAEPLLRRALAINEAEYGADHNVTGKSKNNLGLLLYDQSRYAEAEPLLREAVAIDERVFGQDHPTTSVAYNNLGLLLTDTDRLAEAEELFRRALEIDEKFYGTEHPTTSIAYNNLALWLLGAGRSADAEPIFRKALAIDQRILGDDHPYTSIAYYNLALSLIDQGRDAEAEPLLRRSVQINRKVLGSSHSSTQTAERELNALLSRLN